jgi:hypothetical protein
MINENNKEFKTISTSAEEEEEENTLHDEEVFC